mmetsp:Transcript_94326/g.249387  ORF Transcript_94326/g.249387 Transcript_94326/m.249387 type:complete len:212 (-) Transcript_94326:157-792(-)
MGTSRFLLILSISASVTSGSRGSPPWSTHSSSPTTCTSGRHRKLRLQSSYICGASRFQAREQCTSRNPFPCWAFILRSSWFPRFRCTALGNRSFRQYRQSSTSGPQMPLSTKSPLKMYAVPPAPSFGSPCSSRMCMRSPRWPCRSPTTIKFWPGPGRSTLMTLGSAACSLVTLFRIRSATGRSGSWWCRSRCHAFTSSQSSILGSSSLSAF